MNLVMRYRIRNYFSSYWRIHINFTHCVFHILFILLILSRIGLSIPAKDGRTQEKEDILIKNNLTFSEYFNAYFGNDGKCHAIGNDEEFLLLNSNGIVLQRIKTEEPSTIYDKRVEGEVVKFLETNRNIISKDGLYIGSLKLIHRANGTPVEKDGDAVTVFYLKDSDNGVMWEKSFAGIHEFQVVIAPEASYTVLWASGISENRLFVFDKNGISSGKYNFHQVEDVRLSDNGLLVGILGRIRLEDDFKAISIYSTITGDLKYQRRVNDCVAYDGKLSCDKVYFEFEGIDKIRVINLTSGISETIDIVKEN